MPEVTRTSAPDPEQVLLLTEQFGQIGFWRVDITNQSVFWSDQVFEIHGVDPSEGEPPLSDAISFYHPDDVGMVQQAVDEASKSGKPFEFHGARIVRPDGTERYVYSKGQCRTDEDGNTTEIYGIFQDVSEQVARDRALRDAQARMELVVQAGLGIWEYEVASDSVLVSVELGRILGMAHTEPRRLPLSEFLKGVPDDERERLRAHLFDHIAGKADYRIEHRAYRQDGSVIWLRSLGRAERDSDGKAVRVAGSVEDITPIREATEALKEANSRFDLAVRGASVGIWEIELPSGRMFVSDRLKELVGTPVLKSEDADRYVWKIDTFLSNIHPEDRDRVRQAIDDHLTSGTVFEQQYRYRHTATGEFVHALIRGQAEWDEAGRPIRMAGSLEDVSVRVAHEEALRASEERFKLAAEGASVGIWDWIEIGSDPEYWSPLFYRLLGLEPGEIEPSLEGFGELLHPDDTEKTFAAVDAHFKDGKPFHLEYRLRHKTKGYRWFLGSGQAAFDEDGNPVRMVGSIQDIHARKVAEQRLVTANRDLEQFASVASHDLQEPLRKVAQFSTLLEREYADVLSGNGETYLHFLIDGANRMSRLVNDLLTYARMGETALSIETVNVAEMVADLRADLSESIRESGARVTVSAGAEIEADRELLRRVLLNLISNAIKYRSEAVPEIRVSVQQDGLTSELAVSDNGMGFDPEQAEAIFEIFRRLHRKETHAGTGLGLAICKRIADMHDGTIRAESVPGKGSRFILSLPRLNAARTGSAA
ncbi:PAS domain-containing protein [Hyphobacterium marinum]|uniref:histidine kinase n=1 Tax=Hyphobacterium marinum TaxID=3116574 RepID=A0ABU7LXA2_9PROT|nr:PAS domain-containing protein [Hyphobacterium sp. Y6023]MEE2565907.1 PAS domain-containing protein [Hyphobacterium sp. Y6023]